MPVVSRRTVAALAAFLGLLGVLSFAVQSRAATDNNNLVQALRAGHGATFPDQADTDPLNFDNIASLRAGAASAAHRKILRKVMR